MPNHPDLPKIAWSERYHIDLASLMFCRANCKTPGQIASVDKTHIWLIKEQGNEVYVDRHSGYLFENVTGFQVEATCIRKPATILPHRKF